MINIKYLEWAETLSYRRSITIKYGINHDNFIIIISKEL